MPNHDNKDDTLDISNSQIHKTIGGLGWYLDKVPYTSGLCDNVVVFDFNNKTKQWEINPVK